jgi:hypothetical protein
MVAQPAFVITCVHGTFARRAKWTDPESEFAQSVKALLPGPACFCSHSWSGANTQKARRFASSQLKQKLLEQFDQYPTAAHFLIGHSHGGNIALYALDDEAIQLRMSGVVCINTPFVTATTRHTQNLILFLIASLSLSVAILLSLLLVGFVIGGFLWLLNPELVHWTNANQLPMVALPIVALALIVTLWLFWRLFRLRTRIDNFFQRQRDQQINAIRLPTIKHTPILCLWSCSDEIYGLFSFFEGLANLPYILMHAFFSSAVFLASAGYAYWLYLGFAWGVLPSLWSSLATSPAAIAYNTVYYGTSFAALLIAPIFVGFAVLFQYLAVLLISAIPLNFMLRIIPVGISFKDVVSSFFVRLSFTFVPLTAHKLQFCEVVFPPRFLNHSAAYSNENSIRIMSEWMKQTSLGESYRHSESTKEFQPR